MTTVGITHVLVALITNTQTRKTPPSWHLVGVVLTCSNPATKGAPCIQSLIVCWILQRIPFHRHPSGVHVSAILADAPFILKSPQSQKVITILAKRVRLCICVPCRPFILKCRIFFLKMTNPWVFPVPYQRPADEYRIPHKYYDTTQTNKNLTAPRQSKGN